MLTVPVSAFAYGVGTYYGQPYYEGYYQGYYQGTYYSQAYYQSVYYSQGSYQKTISVPTTIQDASTSLSVASSISKAAGTFVIDHPLDPLNKLLFHSFVESPEAKNIYDGIVTLNALGEALVKLPSYFDALNTDVRYQLKPIGVSMPNLHVKTEEKNNQFEIGGGVAGKDVSWQITGVRRDAYILANPIIPEVKKGPDAAVKKGEYLFDGYDQNTSVSKLISPLKTLFSWLFGQK